MHKEEKITLAVVGVVGSIIVGAGVADYLKVRKVERAKRARIKEWQDENKACIENFTKRMTEVLNDPDTNMEDFWFEYNIENRFLGIVINRPIFE